MIYEHQEALLKNDSTYAIDQHRNKQKKILM